MLLPIKGEPKYVFDTDTGQLVNRLSNKPIPADEPVIIFRAQDGQLPSVLARYVADCKDRGQRAAASIRLAEILQWQNENPLLVKEPDTLMDEEWGRVGVRG